MPYQQTPISNLWFLSQVTSYSQKISHLAPRSIFFEIPPFGVDTWKLKSNLWRWRNTSLAILRTDPCATFSNKTLFNSSKPYAAILATPSAMKIQIQMNGGNKSWKLNYKLIALDLNILIVHAPRFLNI